MTFSPTVAVLLVLLGVGVGAFGTIVGSGGGFILTPILFLLLLYPHDRPATITAISLTAVFLQRRIGFNRLRPPAQDRLPKRPRVRCRRTPGLDRRCTDSRVRVAVTVRSADGRRPRRAAAPRDCVQHRARLRLQLPRHRRRHHPRAIARPRTRLPNPPCNRNLPLRPLDHRRRRRSHPRRHRELRPRPRHTTSTCTLDRRRRWSATRRALSLRTTGPVVERPLSAALLALAIRLSIAAA